MDVSKPDDVGDAAGQAARSKPVRVLGRGGLVAHGLVHVLIAYLAVRIAIGTTGAKANRAGALQEMARNLGGRVLLWAIAVGLAALVVWQVSEAFRGHDGSRSALRRWMSRGTNLAEAVVFGTLGFLAAKIAAGKGAGGGGQTATARVLGLPFGPFLLGAVGVGVVVVMAVVAYRGVKAKFTSDMDFSGVSRTARQSAIRLGQVGHVAVAVAYAIAGILIVVAAIQHDPSQPVGLDGALQTLAGQPFGKILLFVLAAGWTCFGLYCGFDARYRRD
ncbi:DUF1206 domain-containing protein [Flindersiella endophytica]